MPPEPMREFASYDEWGARRHLVVSERLRRRRRELGLTQMEVVVRLQGLGVNTSNKTVSSLEHGAGLDVAKLPAIASALECTITYLVGLTDDPARWEPDHPPPVRGEPAPRPEQHSAPRPPAERPWILGPLERPERPRVDGGLRDAGARV
jgi:transcriptional regulator with XRE-family HTH domain